MITWQLWRALNNPPAQHPIFKRLTTEIEKDPMERVLQHMLVQGQIWLWPLLFMVRVQSLILIVFSGTLYGAIWAVRVSGLIAAEREKRTYELLCLSPIGQLGATWMMGAGCLHRGKAFQQINSREAWSVRVILLIPILISAPFILRQVFSVSLTISFVGIMTAFAVFYLDHVQSILFGSLLGMLAAHFAPHKLDQRLWALAGFLGIQIGSYGLLIVAGLTILPSLYADFIYREVGIPLTSLLIFYGLREYILRQLYRRLIERTGGAAADMTPLANDIYRERFTGVYADAQIVARTP